jgi:hypothetical protein
MASWMRDVAGLITMVGFIAAIGVWSGALTGAF